MEPLKTPTNIWKILISHYFQHCENLGSIAVNGQLQSKDLSEVAIHILDSDSSNRHDIKKGFKSNWVKWADYLRNWDVKLTDQAGREWVPRLKGR
jgi:hypothetical protein